MNGPAYPYRYFSVRLRRMVTEHVQGRDEAHANERAIVKFGRARSITRTDTGEVIWRRKNEGKRSVVAPNTAKEISMEPIRQGDVMLIPVNKLPADVEDCTPKKGRVVVMEGEATGHAHAFYDRGVQVFKPKGSARPTHLRVVKTEALLRHEEHETAKVPPGIYKIPQQNEYTPSELVRVAD